MKTGTPPRVDGRSLDYTKMELQPGDEEPSKFSYTDTKPSKKDDSKCFDNPDNMFEKATNMFLEKGYVNNKCLKLFRKAIKKYSKYDTNLVSTPLSWIKWNYIQALITKGNISKAIEKLNALLKDNLFNGPNHNQIYTLIGILERDIG